MTRITITTANDIRTWILNTNPGGIAHDPRAVSALVDALQQSDHPAYGTDWSAWLDAQTEARFGE